MKLINLLKKMKSHQYVSIFNESGSIKIDRTILELWVKYDTIEDWEQEFAIYQSKVLSIESWEDGGATWINIVVDYKEED